MPSVVLSPVGGAGQQFFDSNGNVLSGGKIHTYAAGTTTPLATYTNASGNTAHTNPIVLDSAGRVGGEIWLLIGASYKFTLTTSTGVMVQTWDNVTGTPTALTIGVINVRDFGAKGDGVTDDTVSVRAAAEALQSAGGGSLVFPRGTYKLYTDGSAATLADWTALNGVRVIGNGSTLTINRTFLANQTLTLFRLAGCKNVAISDLVVVSPEEVAGSKDTRGITFCKAEASGGVGTVGIVLENIKQTGGVAFFQATKLSTDAAALKSREIRISNIDLTSVGYGIACQYSGDNLTARGVSTVKSHRSYFPYGVRNHDIVIVSKGNDSDDCLLRSYLGFGLENITLDYTNIDSDAAFPAANAATGVSLAPGDQTPGVFRNIKIRYTVRYNTNGGLGHAFHWYKNDNTGAYDTVDRGHVYDNIELSGSVSGIVPATGGTPFTTDGTWGTGETIHNFSLRDFRVNIAQSCTFRMLGSLKSRAIFENATSDSHIYITGNAVSKILVIGCVAQNFTGATTDTGHVDYIGCKITDGGVQSVVNKRFVETEFPTARGQFSRLDSLDVPKRLMLNGVQGVAIKKIDGNLTTTTNIFKVPANNFVGFFRLRYHLVSNQADTNPATRSETMGVKTFSGITTSGGIWGAQLAVANEVTERVQGTASVITVSLVNGTASGAFIAVACTVYSDANARGIFILEMVNNLGDVYQIEPV